MKKNAVAHEFQTLKDDAQALLSATADVAGERVAEARNRVAAALEKGRETWHHLQESAVERAKATDECIREHPYQTIGIAFGLGAFVGFLLSRRG
jgi:ElaB/YqjD/DUF883 family membrane-anchored ribosome-binding protein